MPQLGRMPMGEARARHPEKAHMNGPCEPVARERKPRLPIKGAEKAPARQKAGGFLLLDSALRPIYGNSEAAQILAYPAHPRGDPRRQLFLPDSLRAMLAQQRNRAPQSDSRIEFLSGRRHHLCRAFYFPARSNGPSQANTALVLERIVQDGVDVSEVAKQFHLARREQEIVKLVMLGLTSKDIALRMSITLNTVKSLLRLTMLKMSVTSRSEIMRKIHAQALMWCGNPKPSRATPRPLVLPAFSLGN